MKSLFIVSLFFMISSTALMADKVDMLTQKGAKIAEVKCDKPKLEQIKSDDLNFVEKKIKDENLCKHLNKQQLKAVATYVVHHKHLHTAKNIHVPKDAKCPICGMFVAKYPKWVAFMKDSKGHDLYFDGVKDMMKYYFNNPEEKFETILVSDFYTLKPLNAKQAYFVIGSNVYGPMGEELIPFKTKEDAEVFMQEHYGKKIIRFDEIKEDYLY